MNKLLIILLAVCLVGAHAFVKRDAPASASSPQDALAELQAQLKSLLDKVNQQTTEALNPDHIKQQFGQIVDYASKAVESFKPTGAAQPAA